jgi:hypothetical protein
MSPIHFLGGQVDHEEEGIILEVSSMAVYLIRCGILRGKAVK